MTLMLAVLIVNTMMLVPGNTDSDDDDVGDASDVWKANEEDDVGYADGEDVGNADSYDDCVGNAKDFAMPLVMTMMLEMLMVMVMLTS